MRATGMLAEHVVLSVKRKMQLGVFSAKGDDHDAAVDPIVSLCIKHYYRLHEP